MCKFLKTVQSGSVEPPFMSAKHDLQHCWAHSQMWTHDMNWFTNLHSDTHIHTHTNHTHPHPPTHTHTYTHTHTHTHTHTDTQRERHTMTLMRRIVQEASVQCTFCTMYDVFFLTIFQILIHFWILAYLLVTWFFCCKCTLFCSANNNYNILHPIKYLII